MSREDFLYRERDRDRDRGGRWFGFEGKTPDYMRILRNLERYIDRPRPPGPGPFPPGPCPPGPNYSRIIITSGITALQPNDELVQVDTSKTGGAVTLTLPPMAPRGTKITVQDIGGQTVANPIVINTSVGDMFGTLEPVNQQGNSATPGSDTITANYGGRTFVADGAGKWHVWGRNNSGLNAVNIRGTLTTATTLSNDDTFVPFNGANTFTITLPSNPRPGQVLILKEASNSAAGAITLAAAAGQKIQQSTGALSSAGGSYLFKASAGTGNATPLAAYQYYSFVYDAQNSTWWGTP